MTETLQAPASGLAPFGSAFAWPNEAMHTSVEQLVKRATTDAEFRASALRDPAAAFVKISGTTLPKGFALNLVDNARAQLSMVLPDATTGPMPADIRSHFLPGTDWTEEEAKLAADTLVKKATVDPKFRSLALSNPNKAISELTGKTLPEGFKLGLFDNANASLTVILPDMAQPRMELTESELAAVAGGQSKFAKIFSGIAAVTSSVAGAILSPATGGTSGLLGGVGTAAANEGCKHF
jgi:hypothetical protein